MRILPFAILLFCLTGCDRNGSPESSPIRLTPVQVLELRRAEGYTVTERIPGIVEARRKSMLGFELSGTVEAVHFDEGDSLPESSVLARIDTSRLEAKRKELTALLEEAQAALVLAESNFARLDRLKGNRSISEQSLEAARRERDGARANISRIEAQRKSVEVDLGKSLLVSPYQGSVSKRLIDEGAVVTPNQPVFEIVESGHLEVRAALADAAGLEPGEMIPVQIEGDRHVAMKVVRISPVRDPRTRTVDLILEVPPEAGEVRDGDLVSVRRERLIGRPGFFLPRDSLSESTRGLWSCFVATRDESAGPGAHRLDRRDVELIHETSGEVFVRGALRDGDRVVTGGLRKLSAGQRVRVIERPAPGEEGLTRLSR